MVPRCIIKADRQSVLLGCTHATKRCGTREVNVASEDFIDFRRGVPHLWSPHTVAVVGVWPGCGLCPCTLFHTLDTEKTV